MIHDPVHDPIHDPIQARFTASSLPRRVALALAALTATSVAAATVTVDFTGGANTGGWTWGIPVTFPASGGNPGAYLRTDNLDTFAPQLRTQGESIFTGDFRSAGVTSIGIDLKVFDVDFSADGRPLALMLVDDNGTPGNTADDWAVYTLGPNIPSEGAPWKSFDFVVPSQATSLPPNWKTIKFGAVGTPSWNTVIADVDRVIFFYGDPEFFFIFQMWDLGADNVRISFADPPVPGDLDGDGDVDGADLGILLAAWGASGGVADLDGSGAVDGGDLGVLLANWE
ncbi:MAG: hypothetical protein U0575_09960 [Phycisphaerales bacterium]|jgi:hypothetical protein